MGAAKAMVEARGVCGGPVGSPCRRGSARWAPSGFSRALSTD